MNRRGFLATLTFGLAGARRAPPPPPAPPPRVPLLDTHVAGFRFHDGPDVQARLAPGLSLRLVRDPGNRHDPNAIRLFAGDHFLGFVPREENAAPARLLDHGRKVEAVVTNVDLTAPPWKRVRVRLELTS